MRKIYLSLLVILFYSGTNAQWTSLTSGTTQDLNGVFASADNSTVWVVGSNGTYRKSTNGGTTWNPVVVPGDNYDIFFRPDNMHGWIASQNGIYYATDGGTSWTLSDPGGVPFTSALSVHFFDNNNGLAGGQGGNVYSTVDGGLNWVAIAVSADNIGFNGIQFGADANTAWAVGRNNTTDEGVIYKLTRVGGVWTPALQLAVGSETFYDIDAISNSIAWAAGPANSVYKTTNGSTWSPTIVALDANGMASIEATSATKAIGTYVNKLKYTVDGSNWQDDAITSTKSFLDISIASESIAYVVGFGGTIMKTTAFILPITLSSFTAQSQNKKVLLNWSTSMELNNTGFAVMRKTTTSNNWEQVGFVRSFGNSNTTQSYSFTDEPKSGETFLYQLKQIDIDGKSSLSNILKVKLEIDDASLAVYPNPFKGQTTINYSVPTANRVQLVIRNQFGQIIKTVVDSKQQAGNYAVTVNAHELAAGSYYAELRVGETKKTVKLNLIR